MNLFFKIFIKNYQDTNSPKVRIAYGSFASLSSIFLNFILFAGKLTIAFLSNSLSITADALNNLSDFVSSIASLTAFKLSSLDADDNHPFGHGRFEYISGTITSVLIFIMGFQMLISSIKNFIRPTTPIFSWISIAVLFISIFLKLLQYFIFKSCSQMINSESLKASAVDSRNDIFSTLSVIAVLIFFNYFHINLDGILSFSLSIFIIYSGFHMLKETSSPILGEIPSPELVKNIKNELKNYPSVVGIHDLVVHNYGHGKIFATVHCEVLDNSNLVEIHDEIDIIESEVSKKLNLDLVIHMDPVNLNDQRLFAIKEQLALIVNERDDILDFHDLRIVKKNKISNIVFDVTLTPSSMSNKDSVFDYIKARLDSNLNEKYEIIINFDISYI